MNYLFALVLGLALTMALTPVALWLARRFNLIDYATPGHPGRLQTKPLPRGGGLAMYGAFVVATLLLIHPISGQLVAILIAAGLNVVVGTIDDRRSLSPYLRLGTLALSGIIVVLAGVTIPFVTNPFAAVTDKNWLIYLDTSVFSFQFAVFSWTVRPIADGLALIWIVWLINSLNWSKGIGGQLSGISAIAAVTLGGTALMFTAGNPAQYTTALLCFILAGCALGFLPFNFPPERQLPGYGASSFLGLMLAVLSMLSGAKLAAAILVLGIPTIDGIITVTRRLAAGKLPFWGDTAHLYHRLLDLGLSKRQIVIIYWGVTAIFGILALALSGKQKVYAFAMVAVVIVGSFLTVRYLQLRRDRLVAVVGDNNASSS